MLTERLHANHTMLERFETTVNLPFMAGHFLSVRRNATYHHLRQIAFAANG
jgi:hypothetical protein